MNELDNAFVIGDKIPRAVVPFNDEDGTVNISPATNPDPLLITFTDETDPVVSNTTSKTAPTPANDPVAPTAV